jgi:SAM-dependent methyltransferase
MKQTRWRAYGDLAWTDGLSPLEEYADEARLWINAIRKHARRKPTTLLHLGCGAGGHDAVFKKHFQVTGVDVSSAMLDIARKRNPETKYLVGDMRTIRLKESFDVVAIPDSIGHMVTKADLRKAVATANEHLKPGGVLLIVAAVREEFRENNFIYKYSHHGIQVTVFENNYIRHSSRSRYEATVVYLIRRKGKLEIDADTTAIGLFGLSTWLDLLKKSGLRVRRMRMDHSYDRFITGDGRYPLVMFVCSKPV